MDVQIKNNIKDIDEFVSTIVVNKEGKFFVFTREDNLKLDPGKKDFISGHIKANGEIPIQAMYREILEETGIQPEEIVKFYNLGTISLPHPQIKDKICHVYCIVIDFTKEQLSESIKQRAKEKEIKEVEEINTIKDLITDIKDLKSNWRIFCSKELEEKIDMANNVFEKEKQQEKVK